MFLTVLSAIALTVGSAMTIQDVNEEQLSAAQQQEPVVDVAPLQEDVTNEGGLGW